MATKTPKPIKDVSYGSVPGQLQTIFPAVAPGSATVLLIHGGGWRKQPKSTELGAEANALQKAGNAVFDVNYPQDSTNETAFPKEPEAIEQAVSWAIAHAGIYNADPDNVILIGGSAGGHLAVVAAESINASNPGQVDGVVSLSGPTDLEALLTLASDHQLKRSLSNSLGQALGCGFKLDGCSQAYAGEWSPAQHVQESCPAYLLASAQVDEVPMSQRDELTQQLDAWGCPVSTVTVTGRGHAFSYWHTIRPSVYSFIAAH